ncbi:MAG: endonuclease III [bacterium JZ-2024 1]
MKASRKTLRSGMGGRSAGKPESAGSSLTANRKSNRASAYESAEQREARAREIVRRLFARFPDADCTLNRTNPLELLVATILSAQCTDERVNKETPAIFAKYRTAKDYAEAPLEELEQAFKRTGFYKNKARAVKEACKGIVERFNGQVPASTDDLLSLRGIGRKTANVVLGTAFGIPSGITVDTHVFRVAHRLGLSLKNDPDKVEKDLMSLIPQKDWVKFGHATILFGRHICKARKPSCAECPLSDLCPSAFKV